MEKQSGAMNKRLLEATKVIFFFRKEYSYLDVNHITNYFTIELILSFLGDVGEATKKSYYS